jgi:hypothetical protein
MVGGALRSPFAGTVLKKLHRVHKISLPKYFLNSKQWPELNASQGFRLPNTPNLS